MFSRQTEFALTSALMDFLLQTEARPGMYFGSHDQRDAQRVLTGWQSHRRAFPDDDAFAELFFTEFRAFVAARFDDRRTLGWGGMIAERAGGGAEGHAAFMALIRDFAASHWRRATAESE